MLVSGQAHIRGRLYLRGFFYDFTVFICTFQPTKVRLTCGSHVGKPFKVGLDDTNYSIMTMCCLNEDNCNMKPPAIEMRKRKLSIYDFMRPIISEVNAQNCFYLIYQLGSNKETL